MSNTKLYVVVHHAPDGKNLLCTRNSANAFIGDKLTAEDIAAHLRKVNPGGHYQVYEVVQAVKTPKGRGRKREDRVSA